MMDKVASSPALATAEGWPVEETPALSENEVAALGVALGVGMSVIANTDETPERHTVADLASLDQASSLNLASVGPSTEDIDVGSTSRLQTLSEASEGGSQEVTGGAAAEDEEEDSSQAASNKVASFYIGDEHGCTRDLPPAGVPDPSLRPPLPPRRVQIQELEAKKTTVEFTPPDGGYGWVVALAACVVNFWIVGFIKSYGVLYVHVRNAFPDTSAYHASWLPALLSTIGLIIAPVTGVLCRRFTSRKVSFFGGIFCFLGLALGSLSMSMNQLILSTGILTGLGAGLTTTPGVLIVSLYFEKRRALASAICVSGNALGGFFLPPLVDHLLSTYGLRGTMLILAAMQLHICAASMLYRPIRQHALIQAMGTTRVAKEDEVDAAADLPEHKLLPNTPATPRPTSVPPAASAPNTPLSRPHAIWQKMVRRRLTSVSVTVEDEELKGQVSFLRSSSMMNSIPDLTQYARSWSISVDRASLGSRSSSIRLALDSKSSLSRLSLGGFSKSSLNKLTCGELRHPPLMRLASDSEERTVRHPTLLRLASEEDSRVFGSRVHGGSARRLSHPRPVQASSEGRVQRQPSCRSLEGRVQRQPSCRRVQSRIMDAVKEQDTDSQVSDELEERLQKLSEQEQERVASEAAEGLPATKAPSVEVLPIGELSPRKAPLTDMSAKEEAAAPDAGKKDEGEKEDSLEDEQLVVLVKRPNCCCAGLSSCLDLSLFTNPLFMMMALSVFFMASGAPHAIFFLPAYATSIDIPSSKVPHMLSISSMVDLCGRLGIGFISDIGIFKISHLYFISALAAGVATLMVPQMNSFASLSVALGIYGYGIGAWFVLIPTLLAKHHGAARLASSYGLVRLFHGLMNFISPQISGLMIDTTGDFGSCYYFMGSFMALSATLLLFEPALVKYSAKKSKEKQVQEQALKTQV